MAPRFPPAGDRRSSDTIAFVPEAFGPYTVYEQLGVGGMAEVHRAEQAGI